MESSLSGSLRCADCSTAKSLALVCESHGENARTPVPSAEKEQGTPAASLAPDALEPTPPLDHERLDVFRRARLWRDGSNVDEVRPSLTSRSDRTRLLVYCAPRRRGQYPVPASRMGTGARRTRRDRHHFFSMAQGSAMECALCGELVALRASRRYGRERVRTKPVSGFSASADEVRARQRRAKRRRDS
jgi:hypothetical protein